MAFVQFQLAFYFAFSFFFSIVSGQGQCQFDPKCFKYSVGCTLANANPYERTPSISCTDCLNRCLQQQSGRPPFCCRSAVYDSRYQTCDLFAVTAMYAPQHLTKMSGRCYFQPTGYCSGNTPAPAPATQAPANDCPSGQTAKIVAIKDYSYPGITGTTVPNVDATACAQACLKNMLPNGSTISCKSAQFSNNQCVLSTSLGNAEGTVQSMPGATYYQKLCFPTSSVANCPDIFEEDPQKILIGQNRQTVDATSIQDCMQKCLDSQKNYGFVCKSGMYFYQETSLSCILNIESKSTKPDLFTESQGDKVTYFEPGCNGGTKLAILAAKDVKFKSPDMVRDQPVINGEWTMWSPCGVASKQIRYMQCDKTDPRQCQKEEQPCPGSKSDDNDEGAWFKEGFGASESDIHDGNAKSSFTPCRAFFKNGNKNCTFGMQTVDGDVIYCKEPIDC